MGSQTVDIQGKTIKKNTFPAFNITNILFLLLFLGLNLNGCSPDESGEYEGSIENLKIGIDKYVCYFYGLLFLAEIEGFFNSQGLEIILKGASHWNHLRQGGR